MSPLGTPPPLPPLRKQRGERGHDVEVNPLQGHVLAEAPPGLPSVVGDTRLKVLQARIQCAFPTVWLQSLPNALKPLTCGGAGGDPWVESLCSRIH